MFRDLEVHLEPGTFDDTDSTHIFTSALDDFVRSIQRNELDSAEVIFGFQGPEDVGDLFYMDLVSPEPPITCSYCRETFENGCFGWTESESFVCWACWTVDLVCHKCERILALDEISGFGDTRVDKAASFSPNGLLLCHPCWDEAHAHTTSESS